MRGKQMVLFAADVVYQKIGTLPTLRVTSVKKIVCIVDHAS
ncbi:MULTISPECIES: hypothetical protein [Bacillus]|uniref:Uncharacterized protein n=1 Tax=Bacillus pumilus TaxID=1408 RepID=A0AB34R0T6_BACPU|nr:hypothetical protein [Bacillus pumilus]KIL23883.1 hypothetical protein B4127_3540 [Bacillus pumilus]RAP06963.1 hypothetical protein C2W58_01184 [Bacillus pumilus]